MLNNTFSSPVQSGDPLNLDLLDLQRTAITTTRTANGDVHALTVYFKSSEGRLRDHFKINEETHWQDIQKILSQPAVAEKLAAEEGNAIKLVQLLGYTAFDGGFEKAIRNILPYVFPELPEIVPILLYQEPTHGIAKGLDLFATSMKLAELDPTDDRYKKLAADIDAQVTRCEYLPDGAKQAWLAAVKSKHDPILSYTPVAGDRFGTSDTPPPLSDGFFDGLVKQLRSLGASLVEPAGQDAIARLSDRKDVGKPYRVTPAKGAGFN